MGSFYRGQYLQLISLHDASKIDYVVVRESLTRADNGRSYLTVESSWQHQQETKQELIILPDLSVLNQPVSVKISEYGCEYRPFWSIDDIERYDNRIGGYFFSDNNKRFASSRILLYVYNAPDASVLNLFITSERERYNSDPRVAATRRYTIRQLTEDGVRTFGEFMGYASARSARAAAVRLVNSVHTTTVKAAV